ncbi:Fic family protein [Actinomarinicola tropica]|uniref:Fic family protein n=1 Tax=Actinomarinicola tropica TaxID=2789776 RepID=A0A5Q2RMD3_9ACTN|nr:Fic family protein [Actinomarinicola tropica]QGG94345.1 Fic family protein [Actinomarinicola tropica]
MRGELVSRTWQYDPALYAPARYRTACRYDAFIPHPVGHFEDSLPADLAGMVSDAEAAIRSLNDRSRPALRPLARLLLRAESIASSKVEGLQVDARNLARAEVSADAGRNIGPVVAEVLSNIDAMELAVEETSTAPHLEPAHLVEVHAALMRHAPNSSIAGRVREVQNWIGGNDYNPCGAAFVPPPPEEVPRLLADLCEAAEGDHLPPLVQAAIIHAQFETIHPFEDGNGRTGRALIHVVLRRRGLSPSYVPPISVVLATERERYVRGLTAFREGDVVGWIDQFCVAAAQSASLAERYLSEVADRQAVWRERLRTHVPLRSDAAAWAVIDQLPGHPVITLPVATAVTGRSKSSTAVALAQLEDAGVLVPLSAARRNRAWEADGLLDLLAELEAGGR